MIKFKNVVKWTFTICSGVYVGCWLAGIFVVAPVKAIDNVCAKHLKEWTNKTFNVEEENENEDE